MKNVGLIPNISYDIFVFGADIANYLHLPHIMEDSDEPCSYKHYTFINYNYEVWVEDNKIEVIDCEEECYWQGRNLIGMFYNDFLGMIDNLQPDRDDIIYLPTSPDRGRNHAVFDFEGLGISVWVWRKKIRYVQLATYINIEDNEIGE